MQARLLDDLNRPDLISFAPQYIQDAIRWFQRKPFFFTETDNQTCSAWVADSVVTQGATIQMPVGGTQYAFVALNAGQTGSAPPVFPATLFVAPGTPLYPPPLAGAAGTVNDNGVIWANNGPFVQGVTTGLSTVYHINQYSLPIELVSIKKVEVTWQGNLRIGMSPITYDQLRLYDVVQPPPATYPTWFAFYQQQLYFWPYPNAQYPITLSYIGPPPLVTLPTDVSVWTTTAEACVRLFAEGLINRLVIHDEEAAQGCFAQSQIEFQELVSQGIRLDQGTGVKASDW